MSDKNIEILKLRERGQITLPKRIRTLLGLKPGEELLIKIENKEMILRPKIKDPLQYAGMFGKEEKIKRVKELVFKYKGFE